MKAVTTHAPDYHLLRILVVTSLYFQVSGYALLVTQYYKISNKDCPTYAVVEKKQNLR